MESNFITAKVWLTQDIKSLRKNSISFSHKRHMKQISICGSKLEEKVRDWKSLSRSVETRERDRSSSTQRQHSHMFQVLLFGSSRCLLWLYNRSTTSPLICCYGSIPASVEQVLSASSGDSVSLQSEEIRLFSLSVTESLSDRRHSESPSSNVNGYSPECLVWYTSDLHF